MTHLVYSKGRTSVVTDQEKVTVKTGFRTRTLAWPAIAQFTVEREDRRGTWGDRMVITRLCVRMRDGTVRRLVTQIIESRFRARTRWLDDLAAQLNAIQRGETERGEPKQSKPTDWINPVQMAPGGPPGLGGQPTPFGEPVLGGEPMLGGIPMSEFKPVPVRLRAMSAVGGSDWLDGALHLAPGSLLWQPDGGVSAQPVELSAATMLPVQGTGKGRSANLAMLVEVEMPTGRYQLEIDPEVFEVCQELVTEATGDQLGGF